MPCSAERRGKEIIIMNRGKSLQLSAQKIAELHRLRDFASEHPISIPRLERELRTASGRERHRRTVASRTVIVRDIWDFMITFAIEADHPHGRTCRRLAMSLDRPDRTPTAGEVWTVAQELGFEHGLHLCAAWAERLEGQGLAMIVVQPIGLAEEAAE
jgi:hypothetical protein